MIKGWGLALLSFAAFTLFAAIDGAGTDKTYSGIYQTQYPLFIVLFLGPLCAFGWQLFIT